MKTKNKAFTKKEIEFFTNNRPAYLQMAVDTDTNTLQFSSAGGASFEVTLQYGPVFTVLAAHELSKGQMSLVSVEEVMEVLTGRDPRQNRKRDTFVKLAGASLKTFGSADTKTLVQEILGVSDPTDSTFMKGRRWLVEMAEAGTLFANPTKIAGRKGKHVVMYELDTNEAKEARLAQAQAEQAQKEHLGKVIAGLTNFTGGGVRANDDGTMTITVTTAEKLLQLVNNSAMAIA